MTRGVLAYAGGTMRARSAILRNFRDGIIAGQRYDDCFEPW